nr:uncharacterized protein LOC127342226 isoform X2 [Lolium perenne]
MAAAGRRTWSVDGGARQETGRRGRRRDGDGRKLAWPEMAQRGADPWRRRPEATGAAGTGPARGRMPAAGSGDLLCGGGEEHGQLSRLSVPAQPPHAGAENRWGRSRRRHRQAHLYTTGSASASSPPRCCCRRYGRPPRATPAPRPRPPMGKKRAWPRGGSLRIPATTCLCTTGRASASSPPKACLYEQPPRILDRRSVVRPVAAFARKCSRLQDPPRGLQLVILYSGAIVHALCWLWCFQMNVVGSHVRLMATIT